MKKNNIELIVYDVQHIAAILISNDVSIATSLTMVSGIFVLQVYNR